MFKKNGEEIHPTVLFYAPCIWMSRTACKHNLCVFFVFFLQENSGGHLLLFSTAVEYWRHGVRQADLDHQRPATVISSHREVLKVNHSIRGLNKFAWNLNSGSILLWRVTVCFFLGGGGIFKNVFQLSLCDKCHPSYGSSASSWRRGNRGGRL